VSGAIELSNDIGGKLVLDVGNSIAQDELAFFQTLDLQQIGARRMLQGGDRGVEIAVLLLQTRQLLPQLAFFFLVIATADVWAAASVRLTSQLCVPNALTLSSSALYGF